MIAAAELDPDSKLTRFDVDEDTIDPISLQQTVARDLVMARVSSTGQVLVDMIRGSELYVDGSVGTWTGPRAEKIGIAAIPVHPGGTPRKDLNDTNHGTIVYKRDCYTASALGYSPGCCCSMTPWAEVPPKLKAQYLLHYSEGDEILNPPKEVLVYWHPGAILLILKHANLALGSPRHVEMQGERLFAQGPMGFNLDGAFETINEQPIFQGRWKEGEICFFKISSGKKMFRQMTYLPNLVNGANITDKSTFGRVILQGAPGVSFSADGQEKACALIAKITRERGKRGGERSCRTDTGRASGVHLSNLLKRLTMSMKERGQKSHATDEGQDSGSHLLQKSTCMCVCLCVMCVPHRPPPITHSHPPTLSLPPSTPLTHPSYPIR